MAWRKGKISKVRTTDITIYHRCKNAHRVGTHLVHLINEYVGVQVASLLSTSNTHIRIAVYDVDLRDDELLYFLTKAEQEVEQCIDKVEIRREIRTVHEYFNL